jgi:hypothetical protein
MRHPYRIVRWGRKTAVVAVLSVFGLGASVAFAAGLTPMSRDLTTGAGTGGTYITLSASSVHVGDTVTVTGHHLAGNAVSSATYDGSPLSLSSSTISSGSYSGTFRVPASTFGTHSVVLTSGTPAQSPSAQLVVGPAVTLSSTSNVTVGQSITATGTGFPASQVATLAFDGAGVAFTATSDPSGGFSAPFVVPSAVAGAHVVTVSAGAGLATVNLSIVPAITVQAGSGVSGTTASVSGTGFAAGVTPTATFNGVSLALGGPGNAATDTFGSFTDATFAVPSITSGSYALAVTAGGRTVSYSYSAISNSGYSADSIAASISSGGTGLVSISCPTSSGCVSAKDTAYPIYIDGVQAGTVTSDASKKLGANVGLPAGMPIGTHQVSLVNTMKQDWATVSLTIGSSPLSALPIGAAPGSHVTISGSSGAIGNGDTYSVFFGSTSVATGTATSNGSVSSSGVVVPAGWGTDIVSVKDTSSSPTFYTPAIKFTVAMPTLTESGTSAALPLVFRRSQRARIHSW